MTTTLEVDGISYAYGSYVALHETTFTLGSGEGLAVIGPNGAGKSTLMHCLGGLLRPASGQIRVGGDDLYRSERAVKARLAFLPDVPTFYQELTVWEHIQFIALAHGVDEGWEDRAEELLGELGMPAAQDLFPHALSRGMRAKLGIILCLIRPFSILVMDEPDSALDPESVSTLSRMLGQLRDDGASILLSTHNLPFAESLQGRIATMRGGHLDLA